MNMRKLRAGERLTFDISPITPLASGAVTNLEDGISIGRDYYRDPSGTLHMIVHICNVSTINATLSIEEK